MFLKCFKRSRVLSVREMRLNFMHRSRLSDVG